MVWIWRMARWIFQWGEHNEGYDTVICVWYDCHGDSLTFLWRPLFVMIDLQVKTALKLFKIMSWIFWNHQVLPFLLVVGSFFVILFERQEAYAATWSALKSLIRCQSAPFAFLVDLLGITMDLVFKKRGLSVFPWELLLDYYLVNLYTRQNWSEAIGFFVRFAFNSWAEFCETPFTQSGQLPYSRQWNVWSITKFRYTRILSHPSRQRINNLNKFLQLSHQKAINVHLLQTISSHLLNAKKQPPTRTRNSRNSITLYQLLSSIYHRNISFNLGSQKSWPIFPYLFMPQMISEREQDLPETISQGPGYRSAISQPRVQIRHHLLQFHGVEHEVKDRIGCKIACWKLCRTAAYLGAL